MKIILNNKEYELIKEYKDAFNLDEVLNLATEYFEGFDYILGDYAYNKLRLKGFYDDSNKKATDINKYSYIDEYINKYCAYECRYFVLKKKK
ncbi:MAG: YutD family protein [Bacilli bacterium]|nr:YutD family protein [Bacilli bacterium]